MHLLEGRLKAVDFQSLFQIVCASLDVTYRCGVAPSAASSSGFISGINARVSSTLSMMLSLMNPNSTTKHSY